MKPRLYNLSMAITAVLQNATDISYKHVFNDLYTAQFSLPYNDPKNALCETHHIVDIFDGDESRGKYRIVDEPETDIAMIGAFQSYTCEHVIAFLLDDVIDGQVTVGGTGVSTQSVIQNILARQTVERWVLGTCDFNYEYSYTWQDTNLLDALFSIPKVFPVGYHWTYDTSTYPWTLNLVAQDANRSCEIRRRKNMIGIKRSKTGSGLCNRLYCKGSDNNGSQVTIASVNGGLTYIEDATSIANHGLCAGFYTDKSETSPSILLAKGQRALLQSKEPQYSYTAKAADIYKANVQPWYKLEEGKCVHIIDDEKGVDVDAMIISVEKPDVDGDPLDMDVVISTSDADMSTAIETLTYKVTHNMV